MKEKKIVKSENVMTHLINYADDFKKKILKLRFSIDLKSFHSFLQTQEGAHILKLITWTVFLSGLKLGTGVLC